MTEKELRKALDTVKLSGESRERIYGRILGMGVTTQGREEHHMRGISRKKRSALIWIPAACALCLCVGIFAGWAVSFQQRGGQVVSSTTDNQSELAIAEVNLLDFDGKVYYPVYRKSSEIQTVDQNKIGKRLDSGKTDIAVYEYKPLGCLAKVVKKEEEAYYLYEFGEFKSYEDNRDEASQRYLEVYGVHDSGDIKAITVTQFPDATSEKVVKTITNSKEIKSFYDMFIKLTDGSEKYFKMLEKDYRESSSSVQSDSIHSDGSGGAWSASQEGTHALNDSSRITLNLQNGLTVSWDYYPRIGFLGRYELPADLLNLLVEWTAG